MSKVSGLFKTSHTMLLLFTSPISSFERPTGGRESTSPEEGET
jgi:hypothetical protein